MKITGKMKKDLRAQARTQARIEKQIEKEIESSIEEYREWCTLQFQEGNIPLTIIAEGDSWFNYSIAGTDVIDYLEQILNTRINNLAKPGDEAREMLTGEQKERLERELKRGPANKRRKKYDIFLFSGGGNDLVGKKTFYKWFHDYKKGMQPKDILNRKAIRCAFDMLELNYNELFSIRDRFSKNTQLFLNAYDFASMTLSSRAIKLWGVHHWSVGHCGATSMKGRSSPWDTIFGGPCFFTRLRSLPRSPAPCKKRTKGHLSCLP